MQGFLIDGFPMDVNQAKAFEADLGSPKAILFFEANDEVKKNFACEYCIAGCCCLCNDLK